MNETRHKIAALGSTRLKDYNEFGWAQHVWRITTTSLDELLYSKKGQEQLTHQKEKNISFFKYQKQRRQMSVKETNSKWSWGMFTRAFWTLKHISSQFKGHNI